MLGIIRSELTKILTLPSVWITAGVILAVNLFFQYQSIGFNIETVANIGPDGLVEVRGQLESAETVLRQALEASLFSPSILLCVLGAVIAGAEFRTGQLGLSLVAVPGRVRLVLGKIIATTVYALGFGLFCIALAAAFLYVAARDWNPGILWSLELLAGEARILLFMVTFTLIPLAITLITRRTLSGIIVAMVLVMLTMAQVVAVVSPAVDAFLPVSAARNLLLQGTDNPVPLTGSAGHGAMVLIGWTVLTCIASVLIIRRRDA
ncbi:hypothetical protein [Actinoalloteichus hymeniacidonis]|uniref:ABC-2 family transporter protein n=1 Tax=Actinoalloteichus hymeniacidonis TaxID=340345 RepID=A0AAC9MXF7_9PSEU|nr:hypothetical protein [Actinoalloteichus hymeniacidonis]AOS63163.1 ABC-2 family transporter protein [Actinoalloteichus hymeniacidonis]MBB5908800.1 ABC-type transport system involved in multi-copper enzyme maturation permease subunit [Actinoalloteichus hymeniacidonis]